MTNFRDSIGLKFDQLDMIRKRRVEYGQLSESCCSDYKSEVSGWKSSKLKTGDKSPKVRPYRSPEHHLALIQQSQTQVADCEIAAECMIKLVNLITGDDLSFAFEKFDAIELSSIEQDEREQLLQCIDVLSKIRSGHQVFDDLQELTNRLHRDGEVFIFVEQDGENVNLIFIEPCNVSRPGEEPLRSDDSEGFDVESWSYGIVAPPGRTRQKSGYWIEGWQGQDGIDEQDELNLKKNSTSHGYVTVDLITHIKRGVDKNDPRGVPIAKNTLQWSHGIKMVLDNMIGYTTTQLEDAVVETINDAVDVASHFGEMDIDYIQKRMGLRKKSGDTAGEAGRTTVKGKTIENKSLGSIAPGLSLCEKLEGKIATSYGHNRHTITGNAAIGNRASVEEVNDGQYRQIEAIRLRLQPIVATIIMSWLEAAGCNIELLSRVGSIKVNWPPVSDKRQKQRDECELNEVGAGARSIVRYQIERGIDPRRTREENLAFESGENLPSIDLMDQLMEQSTDE